MARRPVARDVRTGLVVVAAGLLSLTLMTGVIELPSVGDALADLSNTLGAWTYLVVPLLAFLETAAFLGLVVPGETAVLVGGVVAERGEVSLGVLLTLVWLAAVLGDLASFLLGRRLGRPFLTRYGGRLHISAAHTKRAQRLFEQHGGKAVVLGRFVGVLRAITPFVAATSGMSLRRFVPYSVGGALVWSSAFTLAGYLFSESFASAGEVLTRTTLAVATILALAAWVLHRRQSRTRPGKVSISD